MTRDRAADEFVIRGIVDGRPTVARWVNGHLVADAEVVRRAEVIVAMGEVFADADDPTNIVPAALDDGTVAALLTTMRAFTVVTSVEVPLCQDPVTEPPDRSHEHVSPRPDR